MATEGKADGDPEWEEGRQKRMERKEGEKEERRQREGQGKVEGVVSSGPPSQAAQQAQEALGAKIGS